MMEKSYSFIVSDLDDDLVKRFKDVAKDNNQSIQDAVTTAVKDYVERYK